MSALAMTSMDLKLWRQGNHYTQRQAADHLKIPLPSYQNYEQGTRAIPVSIAAQTKYLNSGAPAGAKPRHERRPYPGEDLKLYMQAEPADNKAKSMDRYVAEWGGWFTFQKFTNGGWYPTAYRNNLDLADPDYVMPLNFVAEVYGQSDLMAALPLAGRDGWRRMVEFYAKYEARFMREMADLKAAGRW